MATQQRRTADWNRGQDADAVSASLVAARRSLREDPEHAQRHTVELYVLASQLSSSALMARALAVQGQVALHLGDVHDALELSMESRDLLAGMHDLIAQSEVASLRSHVGYFTGAFGEALESAHDAIRLADGTDDTHLRLFVRRNASLVFSAAELPDAAERLQETTRMALAAGDHWEEAAARNDLGWTYAQAGEHERGLAELQLALKAADQVSPNNFIKAVVIGSLAEVELLAGRHEQGLLYADQARALFDGGGPISPFMFSSVVNAQVRARTALGSFDDARAIAEAALALVGTRLPRVNGDTFGALATALRAAGRLEEAYDALSRSAEIERAAFRELEQMRLGLERATLEATVLRDQLERDWLTGLYNRRYLARELSSQGQRFAGPLCVAVIDVDDFKQVNDSYGHPVGDQVLVRLASLMRGSVRPMDVVVRSGGEEFILVMPTTGVTAGNAVSERMRRAIETEDWNELAPRLKVTVSVGVASSPDPGNFQDLVKHADANLYSAKRSGRNRVVTSAPGLR